MGDTNAKLRISLKDGEFELSGSELFVTQQISNFKELIVESLKEQKFELKNPNEVKQLPSVLTESLGTERDIPLTENVNSFPRLFHVENDSIKILKRAPGANNAQKSVATALIYIWAKNSIGQNDVTFSEIRELCKEQSCLDGPNFAKHMKSAREFFVLEGKGKSQKLKITLPGKEKALSLIKDI